MAMREGFLALIAALVFLGWLGAVIRGIRRKRNSLPADRADLPYSVFSNRFDREVSAAEVNRVLAADGIRRRLPRHAVSRTPAQREALQDETYAAALTRHGIDILETLLGRHGDRLSICLLVD